MSKTQSDYQLMSHISTLFMLWKKLDMKKNLHSKEKWKDPITTTKKPKPFKLQEDINVFFFCLIYQGDREGFHSKRGCCKHVFNKHEWY